MKRTRFFNLRVALFIALGLLMSSQGVVGSVQASQQGDMSFGLEGKITKESAGKLTVSSQDNMIFHVTYDDQTKIYRKDGSVGSAADLTVGAQIRVAGSLSPVGVVEARRIHLE